MTSIESYRRDEQKSSIFLKFTKITLTNDKTPNPINIEILTVSIIVPAKVTCSLVDSSEYPTIAVFAGVRYTMSAITLM
jgi:hypothetical protein